MEMKCPVCGAPLNEGKCGYCGYTERIPAQKNKNQDFEPIKTGKEQQTIENNFAGNNIGLIPGVSRKSKIAALLLCIFLGGLGAHRFYAGKVGTGILYLFTGGLCGIGWIVDIILVATGSFKDEFGLPLKQ